MKAGSRTAMAIAIGYVLGKRRKLRVAALLAGAAASGRVGTLGGAAIKRGASLAESRGILGGSMLAKVTPQLGGIANTVRGELLNAGKAAATAVVNNRIESLSDSLHQRTESIRTLGQRDGQDGGRADDEDKPRNARKDDSDDLDAEPEDAEPEDAEPEDSYQDDLDGEAEDYEDEEPTGSYRDDDEDARAASYDEDAGYDDRESDDYYDDEPEDQDMNGSRRSGRRTSPVSRAGR